MLLTLRKNGTTRFLFRFIAIDLPALLFSIGLVSASFAQESTPHQTQAVTPMFRSNSTNPFAGQFLLESKQPTFSLPISRRLSESLKATDSYSSKSRKQRTHATAQEWETSKTYSKLSLSARSCSAKSQCITWK